MARTGGRNSWVAVPATMLSFAIVAALVWLAVPMMPVAVAWVGDTLRGASERAAERAQQSPTPPADPSTLDCRGLYPDRLWSELTWTAGVRLEQDAAPPATSATGLVDALAPQVVVGCAWTRQEAGSIATTLARVEPDAAALASAALRGQGFSCQGDAQSVTCERDQGAVREEHVLRDGFWLISVESAWWPERYGDLVAAQVFG